MSVPVIDVHTHMLSEEYLKVIADKGGPTYTVTEVKTMNGIHPAIHRDGALFMTVFDEMFDYDLRVQNMNKAKVDIAIVSLTCPNTFLGGKELSSQLAQMMNDKMTDAQSRYPDRIRYFASLPWQYADEAIAELERAVKKGAVGVVVLGNIDGRHLTDPAFAPVWEAIDKHALPVLIHPTMPPGAEQMKLGEYHLGAGNGFIIDTTLAISRMIMDGFFDRYTNLKILALHGGGTMPYIIGRLDRCWETVPAARAKISNPPSSYLPQIYIDSVVYRLPALQLAVAEFGEDNVLYGSDYPHNIGDMVGVLSRVDSLGAAQRDKIRGRNAMRIFNL